MKRERVVNDSLHRPPHNARSVPTPGPLLRLFAESFGEPELARAHIVLAATVWSLREQGFVSFEWETERVLRWWAIRGLWEPSYEERVLSVTRQREGTRPGLEGEFLSALDAAYRRAHKRRRSRNQDGTPPTIVLSKVKCSVQSVVCSWFRRPRWAPESHVVHRAKREVADFGYPPGARRRPLSGLLIRTFALSKPARDDMQKLRGDAERTLSSWRSFLVDEPELSDGLLEACKSGIAAMETPE